MSDIQFSKSVRGGTVLRYEGHEYLFKIMNREGKKSWRCRQYYKNKCPSVMTTQGNYVVSAPGVHCHSGDSIQIQANAVLSTVKEAASISQSTTRNLLGEHLINLGNDVLARLPKRSHIERSVRRVRQKTNAVIPIPHSMNFEIPLEYTDMVLYDSGENDNQRILALGSRDLLRYVHGSLWLGDGTFEVVPTMFFQLYTVHCKVGSSYPPIIYFLLPNKTQETYARMIQALKELVPDARPEKILLDFEMAAINAFKAEFPASNVTCCYFHLAQAIIRKVGEVGLKVRFETEEEFQMLVKSLPALSFIPVDELTERFEQLAEAFPDETACNDLLAYFESTYVRGPRIGRQNRNPRYPPSLWNHYDDALVCAPKTTNCTEGFHNSLRSMFLCAHPTVWTLFNGLKRDIAVHRLSVQNAEVQNIERPRNKYVSLSHRLAAKVENYEHEQDKLRYLRAIAHMQ